MNTDERNTSLETALAGLVRYCVREVLTEEMSCLRETLEKIGARLDKFEPEKKGAGFRSMTVAEAAEELGMSANSVRRLCNKCEMPHGRTPSGRIYISREDLESFKANRAPKEFPSVAQIIARNMERDAARKEGRAI